MKDVAALDLVSGIDRVINLVSDQLNVFLHVCLSTRCKTFRDLASTRCRTLRSLTSGLTSTAFAFGSLASARCNAFRALTSTRRHKNS